MLLVSKDWTGNVKSTFVTLGASNHTEHERVEHDYYATEPKATALLLEQEDFAPTIWEPAAGGLHMTKVLQAAGYTVFSSDIIQRAPGVVVGDFLTEANDLKNTYIGHENFDIITNPPYKYALEFAEKSLEMLSDGNKLALFLKITFLEGKGRKKFFIENPPQTVYVSSSRLKCAANGRFDSVKSSAAAYAWFVWTKGVKTPPTIKWIN